MKTKENALLSILEKKKHPSGNPFTWNEVYMLFDPQPCLNIFVYPAMDEYAFSRDARIKELEEEVKRLRAGVEKIKSWSPEGKKMEAAPKTYEKLVMEEIDMWKDVLEMLAQYLPQEKSIFDLLMEKYSIKEKQNQ